MGTTAQAEPGLTHCSGPWTRSVWLAAYRTRHKLGSCKVTTVKTNETKTSTPNPISLCHWGAFTAEIENGRLIAAHPWQGSGADADMIGALPELVHSDKRIDQPYVRAGWLRDREKSDGAGRGHDRMMPIPWETALSLVASELCRVRDEHGYTSLFAGSYGWSSAGRFHHARTQVRRFFGAFGGFTDQVGNYSWGAAQILLEHVLGSAEAVSGAATSWRSIAENTDILVAFGGLSQKNWRVTSGGAGYHHMARHVRAAHDSGTKFVIVSPMADDIPDGLDAEWIAPRPGSDTAIILALCYEMVRQGRVDHRFLSSYCSGWDVLLDYLGGGKDEVIKTLDWAAGLADVDVETLRALANQIADGRVMLTASWSLQRAHRGEQPFWAVIALAAILGQIGLPGGGFTFGYGSLNAVGEDARKGLVPTMPMLGNKAGTAIPVARFVDMLENPGQVIPFNGRDIVFPDTRLIYWAGGNPFHHTQDLFRLSHLWSRPETIIVHEQIWTATALRADIVFPATTSLERNDIGGTSRDPHIFYLPKLIDAVGQSRNDFDIFSDLAARLGCEAVFTEDRNCDQWLRHLWQGTQGRALAQGITAPDFDEFVARNVWEVPIPDVPEILLSAFRSDPASNALPTCSGKIELYSPLIASYGYDGISGHPEWKPPREWLGNAAQDELALLTRQPERFLHSQLNQTHLAARHAPYIILNVVEAEKRGLLDGQEVTVFSPRGACLARVRTSDRCRLGTAVMEVGPHFRGDDALDRGGNPNVLTLDIATSELTQGSAAQSCLVRIQSV